MSYDEERARKSRVVVETPVERREYEHETVRVPERSGISSTTVGIIVVLVVALITILVLMLMNRQQADNMNANLAAAQASPAPQTTIVQQPAAQPIVVTQPAPVAPAPVIVTQPAPVVGGATSTGSDDSGIQTRVDKRIADDPALSSLGITASVLDGKVTLIGTVKSDSIKASVERAVKDLKGVRAVDNQIIVMA